MSDVPGRDTLAPDVQQIPVNTPVGGTQGDASAADRLKAQLPSSGSAGSESQGSAPPVGPPVDPGQAPGGQPAPGAGAEIPGVPRAVLGGGPQAPSGADAILANRAPAQMSDVERYTAMLQALANQPGVSPVTKEFAQTMLNRLLRSD